MSNESPFDPQSEKSFAARLRADAQRERPEFSDALHERIMQMVAPESAPARSTVHGSRSTRVVVSWVAVAASLAIAAFGLWRLNWGAAPLPPNPSSQVVITVPPANDDDSLLVTMVDLGGSLEPSSLTADQLAPLVDSAADQYSWDNLSTSAGLAARLVVDQLPFETPADDWGLPKVE